MISFHPTYILRHKKENLKKCSLRGLEKRSDLLFFTYPKQQLPSLMHYLLLKPGAPALSSRDKEQGLLLIDGTWKYAERMIKQGINYLAIAALAVRSIPPHYKTAYPRRQEDCPDGLASVEALYIAYHILGRNTQGLLDNYHWKEDFLNRNADLIF